MPFTEILSKMNEALSCLIGQLCWKVSSNSNQSLLLDLGGMLYRSNGGKEQQETGRNTQEVGEFDIFIWCSWRLQDADNALCSSDSTDEQREEGTRQIIGQRVTSIEISPPACDASITFTGGLVLKIFCIYTQEDECETNWFFRNYWKLFCVNRANDIEIARIEWDFIDDLEYCPCQEELSTVSNGENKND